MLAGEAYNQKLEKWALFVKRLTSHTIASLSQHWRQGRGAIFVRIQCATNRQLCFGHLHFFIKFGPQRVCKYIPHLEKRSMFFLQILVRKEPANIFRALKTCSSFLRISVRNESTRCMKINKERTTNAFFVKNQCIFLAHALHIY